MARNFFDSSHYPDLMYVIDIIVLNRDDVVRFYTHE